MAVNRSARDALADALAAFMRGDVDSMNFLDRLDAAEASSSEDRAMRALVFDLYLLCDGASPRALRATPERWAALTRTLAFLSSDLQFRPRTRRRWISPAQVSAFLLLFGFAACGVMAALIHPTFLAGLWAISMLAFFYFRVISVRAKGPPPVRRWYPFTSESQWQSAAPLSARFNLPTYDPVVHAPPSPPLARRPSIGSVLESLLGFAYLPLLLFLLAVVHLWPFCVTWDEAFQEAT